MIIVGPRRRIGLSPAMPRRTATRRGIEIIVPTFVLLRGNSQSLKFGSAGQTILEVTAEYTRVSVSALLSLKEIDSKSQCGATRYRFRKRHPASITHPRKSPSIALFEKGLRPSQYLVLTPGINWALAPNGIRGPANGSPKRASQGTLMSLEDSLCGIMFQDTSWKWNAQCQ